MKVQCNGVFCAGIALAGAGKPQPVHVAVDSIDNWNTIDGWAAPRHQVGRGSRDRGVAGRTGPQSTQRVQQPLTSACCHHAMRDPSVACRPTSAPLLPAHHHSPPPWLGAAVQVFLKLTVLANMALRHFRQEAAAMQLLTGCSQDAWTLEGLLLWLSCYNDLFSKGCSVSGRLLVWDASTGTMLPPLLRPFT